ncbi:MAG: hypothetical protein WBB29_15170 [Geitlerinemataceae cyanobacterium]
MDARDRSTINGLGFRSYRLTGSLYSIARNIPCGADNMATSSRAGPGCTAN